MLNKLYYIYYISGKYYLKTELIKLKNNICEQTWKCFIQKYK